MPKYYTTTEVAKMLNFTRGTVQRWCRVGMIDCLKVGSDFRISEESLDAFISKNTKKAKRK